MAQSNITGTFPRKRDCLKINCKVIHRVDMRTPGKVVCVLVGLDFEESVAHHEMFMLSPSTVYSHFVMRKYHPDQRNLHRA